MSTLIVIVILGIGFAYFATQNTSSVVVNALSNSFALPVYALVLGSILLGLLVSAIIYAFDNVATLFDLHSKDTKIAQKQQTVEELSKKVRDLEMENTKLKVRNDRDYVNEPTTTNKAKLFFQKLRHQMP
jgi:putative membrane protein